jgi:hypothetical protein
LTIFNINKRLKFTTADEAEVETVYEDVMVAAPEMSYEEYRTEPEAVFAAVPAVAERPDGIYTGSSTVTFSQPASAQPQVFDLLTSTF